MLWVVGTQCNLKIFPMLASCQAKQNMFLNIAVFQDKKCVILGLVTKCLLAHISFKLMLYILVNNFLVMLGCFLDYTSTDVQGCIQLENE